MVDCPRLVKFLSGLHLSSISPSAQSCFPTSLHRCWALINMYHLKLCWRHLLLANPTCNILNDDPKGWSPKLLGIVLINDFPRGLFGGKKKMLNERGKPYYVSLGGRWIASILYAYSFFKEVADPFLGQRTEFVAEKGFLTQRLNKLNFPRVLCFFDAGR